MPTFEDQDFFPDFYQRLDIEKNADSVEITRAYKKRAKETHPDINKDPTAEAQFVAVGRAYEILKDPATRRMYDRALLSRGAHFSTDNHAENTGSKSSHPSDFSRHSSYKTDYTNPEFYRDYRYTLEEVLKYQEAAARMADGHYRSGDLSTVFNFHAKDRNPTYSLEGPSEEPDLKVIEDKRQPLLSRIAGLLSNDKK